MRRFLPRYPFAAVLTVVFALVVAPSDASAAEIPDQVSIQGVHPGGATFAIDVPAGWNGTVLTFSPGYGKGAGTQERPAALGGNAAARHWLLNHGYALAGTRPFGDGWAVEETLRAVPRTMATFREEVGDPLVILAWGASMGGDVAAALAQRGPELVDGALPYCASLAGPVAMLNQGLDAAFAFKSLLAPDSSELELTGFESLEQELRTRTRATEILDRAQRTAEGKARIALAAAFAQISVWSVPGTPEPTHRDWLAQEAQQYRAFMPTVFSPRYPLERRAGGNFSWNVGVDYRDLLIRSGRLRQVRTLYDRAGLDLRADLRRLQRAERISADPAAVDYMERYFTPTGAIGVPVLTLNARGDNYPTVSQARSYLQAVHRAGDARLLRQAFVDRPGHCDYTGAELVATVLTLEHRVKTGTWQGTSATALDSLADRLSSRIPGSRAADFTSLHPRRMLRPHTTGIADQPFDQYPMGNPA